MGRKYLAVAAIGAAAIMAFAGCSDDDDDPTPTPSPTATTTADTFHVVCPDPIGEVDVTVAGDTQWDPAYVVDSSVILEPVAFGEITWTDETTGETGTDPAVDKPGSTKEGAVECTFSGEEDFEAEDGTTHHSSVEGTVWVREK